jgi:hypothetical protein
MGLEDKGINLRALDAVGVTRAAFDPLADFLPMDGHFGGGRDADPHSFALNGQDRDGYAVADRNHFTALATENQHGQILLVIFSVSTLPERVFRQFPVWVTRY